MATPATSNYYNQSDFSNYLQPNQAGPIFEKAREMSVVQQVARRVPMGTQGLTIPTFSGNIDAQWVAEGAEKPLSKGGVSVQNMEPHKIAAIFVASAEVYRENPANFLTQLRDEVAEAFARAFDLAALHGTNSPFGTFIDQTTKSVSLVDSDLTDGAATDANAYLQFNEGLRLLVNDDKDLNGFVLDKRAEPIVNAAVDANGRPLFVDDPYTQRNSLIRPGALLGRSSVIGDHVTGGTSAPAVLGYGGDWTQAAWGVVGGISYDVSQEATLPLGSSGEMVSLWQNNLIAVRAEAEYAWLVNDVESFVQYTNETDAP